jgi:hypothetical protein
MPHTKTCTRCGETFPATSQYFSDNLLYRDHFQPHCRKCGYVVKEERRQRKRERARAWANANREKVRESARRTYEKNRRQRLAYMARWREENKGHIKEYSQSYLRRKKESQQNPLGEQGNHGNGLD